MIIRPIRKSDLNEFEKLAHTSSLGITNLPKNRLLLEKKIDDSIRSFSKEIEKPINETYIFVLEDKESKKIIGTSGILSKTAIDYPKFFFQIKSKALTYEPNEIFYLKKISYKNTPSEIAGLYLHPDERKAGMGKLLSLSRFLFIAAFKYRFEKSFFSEIRGVINSDGTSPFWDGLGRHFFNVTYQELMKLAETDFYTIQQALPNNPIYLPLLKNEVQHVIGKAHEKSHGALKMLQDIGFTFCNEIDLFDGGPRISVKTSKIKPIHSSLVVKVKGTINHEFNHERFLVSNEKLDFRASISPVHFLNKQEVQIPKNLLEDLNIQIGDKIRLIHI